MALLYKDFIMTLEDSSTYVWIRDKGAALGRVEGELAALHRSILKLGTSRFGPPSTADTATLVAIEDAGKLDEIFDYALVATSWSDLLTHVAP